MRRASLSLALCLAVLAAAGAAEAKTPLPGIRSPSHNISCLFVPGPGGGMLLCQIGHADYALRLVAYCGAPPIEVDWSGFTLGSVRKGSVSCSGGVLYDPDTQRPAYVTLPYGRTWTHAGFACTSRVTGITCRNRHGHGLFVSRESWRAW